jgi:hypothetical protein
VYTVELFKVYQNSNHGINKDNLVIST